MSDADIDAVGAAKALNAKLRDSNHRLHAFLNSLQVLVTALDIPREDDQVMELLSNSLDTLLDAVDGSSGSLLVLDEDNMQLVYVLISDSGKASDARTPWHRTSADTGICGWVLRHGEATIVNDASADDRFDQSSDIPEGVTVETLMCIPVVGQDKNLGVLTLHNKRVGGMFTDDDLTLACLMGRFAGELLHRMSE